MLISLWRKYEKYILEYADVNNGLKLFFGSLLCIFPFIIFNYLLYYFILDFRASYSHIALIVVSGGEGRLLYLYIMYRNKCDFGKGQNWFTLGVSVYMLLVAITGGTYLIIKDINGEFEKEKNVKVYKQTEINTNILNNSNKYDYLLQNNDKK